MSIFYFVRLIKRKFYNWNELEDLIQEFIIKYLKYKNLFNNNKSSFKNYITIIFESLEKDLMKLQLDENNLKKKSILIDEVFDNSNNNHDTHQYNLINQNNLEDLLFSEPSFFVSSKINNQSYNQIHNNFNNDFNKLDLKNDLTKAMKNMPNDLKEIYRLLKDDQNIVSISNKMKLSRKTIYEKIKKIKEYFIEYGLDQYL